MAKIVLFGQAQFGARVMEGLLERGHEITAACVPPGREGRPADPLQENAQNAGVRLVQRKSYKAADAFDEVRAGDADIGVLAFVTQIIPRAILDAPQRASICFHPSLLPAYRGGSAIPWQLINGETVGGITLFRPDDGIDAGPIYLQRELEIGPDDSAGSYYYASVFEPAVEATLEAVELVLPGEVFGEAQDESRATYDPLCRDEHAAIDWTRTTRELHNLIRGCDPSPGAHTKHRGGTVRLYGSRRGTQTGESAGAVLAIGDAGVEIATGDASVLVTKLAFDAGKKPAAEAAEAAGLKVGERLG